MPKKLKISAPGNDSAAIPPQTSSVPWRNRITGYGEEDADQLLANPKNFRIHPKNQQLALENSLDKLGWIQNCVVNKSSGFVVDGHARAALAISRGEKVPCAYVELTQEEEALAIAILDSITEMAGKDSDILNQLIGDIRARDFGQNLGAGIDDLLESLSPKGTGAVEGEDDVPPVPENPVTRLGDLWHCGNHRLLCGDSTSTEAVSRLMDGKKAALFATDPPYGVGYGDETGDPASKFGKIANDESNGPKLQGFLEDVFLSWLPFLNDDAAWYLWHAQLTQGFFAAAAAAAAAQLLVHRQIIWVKPSLVLGHGDYHWRHELCFYGWREGHRARWLGDRCQTTVWEVGRENDGVHPTQKPVELFTRPIEFHTHAGEVCAEPFAGSGTQFIACEKTGRACYGMEISPAYCDVIVQRWQSFAKREATLDGHGATFEHVKAGRLQEAQDALKEEAMNAEKPPALSEPAAQTETVA